MTSPSTEQIELVARRAARRCLWAVEQALLQGEHADAECEFYHHIREEMDSLLKDKP